MSNFGHIDSKLSIFGNATRAAGRHQQPTHNIKWHPQRQAVVETEGKMLWPAIAIGVLIVVFVMLKPE